MLPLPGDEDAARIRRLCLSGRLLDAHAELVKLAPCETWPASRARLLAAGLLDDLGARKRGRRAWLGTYRTDRRTPCSRMVRLSFIAGERGPAAAWLALSREAPLPADATDVDHLERLSFEAHVAAALRDFRHARLKIDEMRERTQGDAAYRADMVAATVAQRADRTGEMKERAEAALAARPDDPDTVALVVVASLLLGERAEAIARLEAAAARTQSPALAGLLATTLGEEKRHDERWRWLVVRQERLVLDDDPEALRTALADCAYDRGDHATARELLRGASGKFHAVVAAALEAWDGGADTGRTLLDVPFVRQRHMTCAPATLTAISAFWDMPADQVAVAEEICYDGTPSHSQRKWGEANGFVVRELTVTADAARALLDRGLPIAVATVQATSAHLQTIVGYDDRRATLFIRDPTVPIVIEALRDEWLAEWRATGPHGMVLVPAATAHRLDGLDLPDAALYEEMHRVSSALDAHDRAAAVAATERLEAEDAGHRLAIMARRAIAAYDQDGAGVLSCARRMSALFPAFVPALLDTYAGLLRGAGRAERLAWLEDAVAANGDAALLEALAGELVDDAREHPRVRRLLARVTRARPDRHPPLQMLGAMALAAGRREEALALARFAACLGIFDEDAAFAYFTIARAQQRTEEAHALLFARAEELGKLRASPIATLARVLDALDRTAEAAQVVERAIERKPEDGEMLLCGAHLFGSIGEIGRARELLDLARSRTERIAWSRAAAIVALFAGDDARRIELLREIVAARPLDVDAHESLARLLLATHGLTTARAHVEQAWAKAPHCLGLARAYLEWQRPLGAARVEEAARRVLATHPGDPAAERALAAAALDRGRLAEARAAVERAREVEPSSFETRHLEVRVLTREGKHDAARDLLARALGEDPDRADLVASLVDLAPTLEAKREALHFVELTVARASVNGVGLMAWYDMVRPFVDPGALLWHLEVVLEMRGELPAAALCRVRQLALLGRNHEALLTAHAATTRFPLQSQMWAELAKLHTLLGDAAQATAALERAASSAVAIPISPVWTAS